MVEILVVLVIVVVIGKILFHLLFWRDILDSLLNLSARDITILLICTVLYFLFSFRKRHR